MMNLFKSYTVYEELVTFIEFLRRQLYIEERTVQEAFSRLICDRVMWRKRV